MFPELDLPYKANLAQCITTADEELDHDLSVDYTSVDHVLLYTDRS